MDGAPLLFAFQWKYTFRVLQAGQGTGFSLRSLFSVLSLIYRSASDSEEDALPKCSVNESTVICIESALVVGAQRSIINKPTGNMMKLPLYFSP